MIRIATILLVLCSVSRAVQADELHAIRPIPGNVCMKLALPPGQASDPKNGIPIRDIPSSSGNIVGWAPSVIIAPAAQQPTDGFIQVLFPDGHRGWVQAVALKPWSDPYSPNSRCVPSLMSNGRIAFDFQR